MADILSPEQRSAMMSRVRDRDTKPEWILRCALHRLGFRYTLGNNHLPGKPDLVLPKYGTVIFVHGCFWHRHPGCKDASTPKGNSRFWRNKFSKNVRRDRRVAKTLSEAGWQVLVVWECQLENETVETIERVVGSLRERVPRDSRRASKTPILERRELLAVAEERVRYRINTYGQNAK